MKPHLYLSSRLPLLCLLVTMLILAACGRGNSSEAAPAAETGGNSGQAPVATMPIGNFTSVGEASGMIKTAEITATQPISESEVTTETATTGTVTTETEATETETAAVDPALLERGLAAYEKNKCADCHGAAGEGVAGKGKAIAGTPLSLEEFDKLLRTGGGLGNTHIFGRSAVSPSGMSALLSYVQSLATAP